MIFLKHNYNNIIISDKFNNSLVLFCAQFLLKFCQFTPKYLLQLVCSN